MGIDCEFIEHEGLCLEVDNEVCHDNARFPIAEITFALTHGPEHLDPDCTHKRGKGGVSQVTAIIDVTGLQGNYATKSYAGCAVSFVRVMHLIIHQKKVWKAKKQEQKAVIIGS
jgi:hypothetical protein